ncbi:MAG: hypothetical protein EOO16_18470 [Chitinophagaceae bacterium]|nr:MAG: hypothetical protein EOO16_18470 [Chitinophagaceae bacterium]
MTSHADRSAWARQHLTLLLGERFEIESVPIGSGDFGELDGFQFNSSEFGGFLYFWSSGVIEYHLVDYKSGVEIVPITLLNINEDESTEAAIEGLLTGISRLQPLGRGFQV